MVVVALWLAKQAGVVGLSAAFDERQERYTESREVGKERRARLTVALLALYTSTYQSSGSRSISTHLHQRIESKIAKRVT